MWDNAPLLRSIGSALFFCCAVAVLYGAGHYAVHMPGLLPVKTVRLLAVPQKVVPEDVRAVVRQEVKGNFLTVDIDRMRKSLEKLPWVRTVSVRREFPNRLAIQFEEHVAMAYWNDTGLVNTRGEVFAGQTNEVLPKFSGYEGSSAEVAEQYAKFSEQLSVLNLKVTHLALSPRHAWRLRLSNNMIVELGRDAMQQRLERFVQVYSYGMLAQDAQGQVVDMRYRNGFAVKKHA